MDTNLILDKHIEAILGIPMSFPRDYCATFAAGVIKDIHGVDILGNRFGGEFAKTEAQAHDEFPMGLAITVARRMRELGWVKVKPEDAPVGALGISKTPRYGHGIAVSAGTGWFIRRYAKGVSFEPASWIIAAWTPPGGS